MKLNQLILATFAGMQLAFPAWAADDPATNSLAPHKPKSPLILQVAGPPVRGSAEIEALKKEVRNSAKKSRPSNSSATWTSKPTPTRQGANPEP